ncbi:hypothetical protein Pryu01_03046 [Paraliobacillus ryukyuensis]|uniref:Uncharacterized protein n=1 Tax=Paraliobacillus ryukyuensis TaxID=200904 RepID=A0A366DQC3_9BACI|nr:hypothetical protein [Paraliobacillus ryukyuensis]RBO92277.1 hypothetical protein DES48_11515 [Paraliobacillus ryukyuensis]
MSNSITPNYDDLMNISEDELAETLSDLNNASLRKLVKEIIKAIDDYRAYCHHLEHKNQLLYGRLNNIVALAEKEIK